jgi:hypothetical protein
LEEEIEAIIEDELACLSHGNRGLTLIQNRPHVDLSKLRVLRQNLLAESAPPRANRARDKATERMASNKSYPGPHLGDPA